MSSSSSASPFGYDASFPLAVVGATLFCLLGGIHFYQFFYYRTWVFYPMLLALLMEMTAFISRAYSIRHQTILAPFLISYITVMQVPCCHTYLAPSFIAAACYMLFGRLLHLTTPRAYLNFRTLWVPSHFLTPLFVTIDLLSFLIQLIGLGSVASAHSSTISAEETEKRLNSGVSTLRIGLIVQLVGFAVFTVVGSRFLLVSLRWKSEWPTDCKNWRRGAWAINVSCALIMLRAVYRVIEFTSTQSQGSYFDRYEWPFWVFDALMILCTFVILAVMHPGEYLPSSFKGLCVREKNRDSRSRQREADFGVTAIIGRRAKTHTRLPTSDPEAIELEHSG